MGEDFRRSSGLTDSAPVEEINPIGKHLGWTSRWLIHGMKVDFPDPDGLKLTISSSFPNFHTDTLRGFKMAIQFLNIASNDDRREADFYQALLLRDRSS
jgi:hypothetical protein